MSKDYDDYDEHDDRGGNKEYYDYDDEISRKAVGKLLTGLDDHDKKPSKPTVKAIRPEAEGESKRGSINTSYYDESRTSRYEDEGDAIVTGFRDDDDDYYGSHHDEEYDDDSEQMELEEFTEMEEEAAHLESARSRRARPGSEESLSDRQERERYRRQFLDGYTDTKRKGTDTPQTAQPRRRPSGASADDAVRRISAEKDKSREESAPRRRPRPTGGETRPQPPATRGRRPAEDEDEVNIIPSRSERRKERSQPVATPAYAGTAPSYDAPIFKIIAAAFIIMLIVMVFLVFKINAANKSVAEYKKGAEQVQADVDAMNSQQVVIEGLRQQVTDLTKDNGSLILERDALKAQVQDNQGPVSTSTPAEGQTQTQPQTPGSRHEYTVVSGDSLSKISNRFYGNSSVESINAIKSANGMTKDSIQVGQKLIIPAQQ